MEDVVALHLLLVVDVVVAVAEEVVEQLLLLAPADSVVEEGPVADSCSAPPVAVVLVVDAVEDVGELQEHLLRMPAIENTEM